MEWNKYLAGTFKNLYSDHKSLFLRIPTDNNVIPLSQPQPQPQPQAQPEPQPQQPQRLQQQQPQPQQPRRILTSAVEKLFQLL